MRAVLVGAVVATLAGCATTRVDIPAAALNLQPATTASPVHCPLRLMEVSDARTAPGTIGSVAHLRIHLADDGAAWLTELSQALPQYGVALTPQTQPESDALELVARLELVRVWMRSMTTSASANLVLRMHYEGESDEPNPVTYRGNETGVVWWGTASEMEGMLGRAATQAFTRLAEDVRQRCARRLDQVASAASISARSDSGLSVGA